MALYRVFTLEGGKVKLPEGAQIEDSYPAFAVVSATDDAVAECHKHYPVKSLTGPSNRPPSDRRPPRHRPEVMAGKSVAAT